MTPVIRRLLVMVSAVLLAAAGVAAAPAGAADPPAAAETAPVASVGPLFFPSVLGLFPLLRLPHFCSASVVHSSSRDLVITAAHCVYGTGPTIEFAPGYDRGATPYGVWDVRRLYVDPAWRATRDPRHDVAILEVAPRAGKLLEDVVGAHPLGVPLPGADVTVLGYRLGSGDRPLACTNALYLTDGYPTFDCTGYTDGVSGGPWLQDGSVVGVTGGLEQGGCGAVAEYSTPFGDDTAALLARAESGGAGDTAPVGWLANSC
jgi:hypothetical protein